MSIVAHVEVKHAVLGFHDDVVQPGACGQL